MISIYIKSAVCQYIINSLSYETVYLANFTMR